MLPVLVLSGETSKARVALCVLGKPPPDINPKPSFRDMLFVERSSREVRVSSCAQHVTTRRKTTQNVKSCWVGFCSLAMQGQQQKHMLRNASASAPAAAPAAASLAASGASSVAGIAAPVACQAGLRLRACVGRVEGKKAGSAPAPVPGLTQGGPREAGSTCSSRNASNIYYTPDPKRQVARQRCTQYTMFLRKLSPG